MKKKFVGLMSIMLFAFMCLSFSGCGDKYKDFEFNITYAFASDAEQWLDGNNGIDIIYGEKGSDSYSKIFDEYGNGKIYIKVEIKNVKSKYLGTISVDSIGASSLNSISTDITPGSVVFIEIDDNDVGATNLKLCESNSRKTKVISLELSRELLNMSLKEESSAVNYAVAVGDSINLKQMNNISFTAGTKQTGVTYQITGIGKIVGGEFVKEANAGEGLKIEGELLKVDYGYSLTSGNPSNYVVEIEAVSTVHNVEGDYISVKFYVYITENYKIGVATYSPSVTTGEGDSVATIDEFVLYPNDKKDMHLSSNPNLYNIKAVDLDYTGLKSIYKSEIDSLNGKIKYKTEVVVDNQLYDFNNQNEGINGLIITREADKFTFLATNADVAVNTVKFRVVLDNVDYSFATVKPVYEREITVKKQLLVEKNCC